MLKNNLNDMDKQNKKPQILFEAYIDILLLIKQIS